MPHKFWIRRIGDVLHPVSKDDKEKCQELGEGVTIEVAAKMPRSSDHHRFFFAAIAEACSNWPETHSFQPDSPEHLRAWLLCKAGYRTTTKHEVMQGFDPRVMADIIEASINQTGGFGFVVHYQNYIAVLTPKSIAWAKLDQKEFTQISNDVSAVLAKEINLSLDDLKREAGRAA